MAFYINRLFRVKKDTGLWVYPILNDIEQQSGWSGVYQFVGAILIAFLGLGRVGCAIAAA